MNWLRRALLELWAIFVIAAVVGFLGPFGSYLKDNLVNRIVEWWMLLMGAYLFVRPWILALRWVAKSTSLPASALSIWGVALTSVPLAMTWRAVGQDAYRELDGYSGLVPFSLLCALAVLGTERWAARIDRRLRLQQELQQGFAAAAGSLGEAERSTGLADQAVAEPSLQSRLSGSFEGPIMALQSEDHYVRVHGSRGSELLLLRLRDAIQEMGGVPGQQVHRSWWVANEGVSKVEQSGRNWVIKLKNGEYAPIARDSLYRLQQAGFVAKQLNSSPAT